MIYRCRKCGCERARGWLPSASCGVYFFLLLGLSLSAAILALRMLEKTMPPLQPGPGGGQPWWVWVVGVVGVLICFAAIVAGAIGLHYVLAAIEYLATARRRCPSCGSRRWSWGFTRGFGL